MAAPEAMHGDFASGDDPLAPNNPQWRLLVANTPAVVLILDRDFRIRFINHTDSGIPSRDVLGKALDDLGPTEKQQAVRERLERVLQTGKPDVFDGLRLRQDGQVHWYEAHLGPIFKEGEVEAISVIAIDVTARNVAEQERDRSEAVLQATIDCLPFDFFALGPDGRYSMQNATSKAHWGDAIGRLPEEVCPNKDDLAVWLDNNRRAFAGAKVEGEVALTLRGQKRFFYNVLAPIRGGNEQYGILGLNVDITHRKLAEEALQKARDELEQRVEERTAELRQSELRFRNYFEQGLIGMAVTSVDKRWLEVNDRLCEILGYSREELVQTSWVALTHPDDIEPNLRLFNTLLAGKIQHFTLNKRYMKKDGSIVHSTIHTRAFRNDEGAVDHIVTLIEDITARKQAEGALRREHKTLRHLLQSSDHERQLIAYEIHDGLAQELAAAIMQFQTFDHLKDAKPKEAAKAFEAGMTMLQQGHFETRRLISGVRPPILDEEGIVAAVAHLVNEERRKKGPKIEYLSKVEFDRLTPILENAVYRIAHEALMKCVQAQ